MSAGLRPYESRWNLTVAAVLQLLDPTSLAVQKQWAAVSTRSRAISTPVHMPRVESTRTTPRKASGAGVWGWTMFAGRSGPSGLAAASGSGIAEASSAETSFGASAAGGTSRQPAPTRASITTRTADRMAPVLGPRLARSRGRQRLARSYRPMPATSGARRATTHLEDQDPAGEPGDGQERDR